MHSIALSIPGCGSLSWYGPMVSIACIVAGWTAYRLAAKQGYVDGHQFVNVSLFTFPSAILFSKVLGIVVAWAQLPPGAPASDALHTGSLAFGGFIGGTAAAMVYLRLHRIPILAGFADACAPAIPLGAALNTARSILSPYTGFPVTRNIQIADQE